MALTPDQKKARALKMLESKLLEGKTAREIADDFGVKQSTVYAALSLAKKAELVVRFEDRLYNELLPLAHTAVLGALQDGNAKIALAILQGTQVLRPNQPRSQNAMAEDDELARYVNKLRAHAALEEQTHDGTIIQHQLGGAADSGARIEAGTPSDRALAPVHGPGPLEAESPGAPQDLPPGFETAASFISPEPDPDPNPGD